MNTNLDIKRGLAYATSSLVLVVVLVSGINSSTFSSGTFWAIVAPLAVPVGLVLEVIYSLCYQPILKYKSKHDLYFVINKKSKPKNLKEFRKYRPLDSRSYQTFLTENNVVRNFWMSLLISGIVFIFIGTLSKNNTIMTSYVEIWLPIVFVLAILANIRTEYFITSVKMYEFKKEK